MSLQRRLQASCRARRVSWPQPVSSQSPAWVCPASLLCSFPRKWKQPFPQFPGRKTEENIAAKETTSGGAQQTGHAPRAALSLQLLGTSRETQQPVLPSRGHSGQYPPFGPSAETQPMSPDTARPHEPGSLNRLYNHGFRNTAGFKGLHTQTNVKTQGSHTLSPSVRFPGFSDRNRIIFLLRATFSLHVLGFHHHCMPTRRVSAETLALAVPGAARPPCWGQELWNRLHPAQCRERPPIPLGCPRRQPGLLSPEQTMSFKVNDLLQ